MRKRKLTQWYPPKVKPMQAGWYQRSIIGNMGMADCIWMNWFDGKYWYYNYNEKNKAPADIIGRKEVIYGTLSVFQWRGLTEPAK